MLDADGGRDFTFATIQSLERWIVANEPAHEGLTPLQREILGTLLPGEIEKWKRNQEGTSGSPPGP